MHKPIMTASLTILSVIAMSTAIEASSTTAEIVSPDAGKSDSIMPSVNSDIIEGHWKELKGKVQQEWGKFTNDDVLKMKGTFNELEGMLQQKYGYEKAEAEKQIQAFVEKHKADLHKDAPK